MTIDMNTVSLFLSPFSILVSWFAIWQAKSYKNESDKNANRAEEALRQLVVETKGITTYALPELKNYGDAMREFMFTSRIQSSLAAEQPHQASSSTSSTSSATHPATPIPTPSPATIRNLREDVLSTITSMINEKGKAPSMMVINALTDRYEFGIIFSEVLQLRDEGKIRWPGDQDAPSANVGLEIISN